ncbi:flagellar basal-body rod protein FlgF [Jonesiaceae bacterium BS-20]|uniref:Flagellar hook protein FlgE n=1 Tax=Jonesiaceae bacterium BS-20 TaxID=3120821 RepID=A0AAU7DZD0_9MICO
MLRSLFSGISGMRAHQTMLDVTGNNIANVNTTGFKASQTQFTDTLSQVLNATGAPGRGAGGTNPAQVGLGVQVAAVTTNFSTGARQTTGRSTDMMISGDGFFVVQKGGQQAYTRAGSFDFDANGNLVSPDGSFVMGWGAQNGVVNPNSILAPLKLPTTTLSGAAATGKITFDGNLPSDAEAATELTRDVEVYDNLGAARTVTLTFTKVDTPEGDPAQWEVTAKDPKTGATTTQTLAFDGDGRLTSGGNLNLGNMDIDLSTLTGFADLNTMAVASRDGQAAGVLESFSITADGTILGAFSNGRKEEIGRIALANFDNASGLEKLGGSMYGASVNSGDPQIGGAGEGGRGDLVGNALEMSNVDLSQEFTNLIVAQRGFQANSRIITTSDEVLQELVNLKR